MERNIEIVQERARNEADLDTAWADDEHDLDLGRVINSRHTSPENDFVDVEGSADRPMSAASTSSQYKPIGPPIIPAMPEVKRSRGRPRKPRRENHIDDG